MRRVLISTKPFIFVLLPGGVMVRSAESLSSAIPLGTSTKRANSKRANHGRSRLFQDAVSSVSFWLRSFPVCGWRTRSLSSVSGLPTRWRCIRGWLMRLLWAYEYDFTAISPFLYERIGTLCRHPCWSLWFEQRIAGWRSGRSEGYCKSLSAGHAPTDLLLLTQLTSRPVPGWFPGDPELTAMLARAAVSIGLEVNRPPSPEPSRLDDWFLGAGRGSQPRPAPMPFFPEVHEELTKSWMAPFTARSPSSASSILTTLDSRVARGYAGIPQVEREIAVHLCPRNAATWRNRPRLPSKACKLTGALAAKSIPWPARRTSRRRAVPPTSQPGPKSSRKSTKQPWRGQPKDVGICSFSGDGENSAAPSPGGGPGGESFVSVPPWASGTHFFKREQFPFPPGSQVHGTTVCDALLPHSRPWPILPVAKRVWFGDDIPPHAPLASPVWDPGSSVTMPQNAPPSVPSTPTPFRCTTTGMSIVPLEPLAQRLEAWSRTIRLGYTIQFARRPPKFNGVLETSVAIEPVPPAERRQGFYSPYFIIPKKRGGLRPILDLRVLNRALHKLPFKMRTRRHIIKCIQP